MISVHSARPWPILERFRREKTVGEGAWERRKRAASLPLRPESRVCLFHWLPNMFTLVRSTMGAEGCMQGGIRSRKRAMRTSPAASKPVGVSRIPELELHITADAAGEIDPALHAIGRKRRHGRPSIGTILRKLKMRQTKTTKQGSNRARGSTTQVASRRPPRRIFGNGYLSESGAPHTTCVCVCGVGGDVREKRPTFKMQGRQDRRQNKAGSAEIAPTRSQSSKLLSNARQSGRQIHHGPTLPQHGLLTGTRKKKGSLVVSAAHADQMCVLELEVPI